MSKKKKTKSLILIVLFLTIWNNSYSQISYNDIRVNTSGLSNLYASRFTDSVKLIGLVNYLNNTNIPKCIIPISINVRYVNGVGLIVFKINYNKDSIFSDIRYFRLNNQWRNIKNGISVCLQKQLFEAFVSYKKSVATKTPLDIDKDLLNFKISLMCEKSNKDYVLFDIYNFSSNRGLTSNIKNRVEICINNNLYYTESDDIKFLDEMCFFSVGKTIGLDGKKTGAFYFSNFFDLSTDK
jgi:hypothetical protein